MSLPTAVTQRAEGTGYIGVTGMEFAVQTGFAIRTGFYLTNSGTANVKMTLELDPNAKIYDSYDFYTGTLNGNDDKRIIIPAGSTKFIPFDFYGLKDVSGPQAPFSGPAGTGSYNTEINLSFRSEIDGTKDRTYYAGQPDLGVIRVNLTGYVTGHFGSSAELTPAYPKKFLGVTGQKDSLGVYYHELKWDNPPTGYYFEKYKIEQSTDATQTWSNLTTIDIPRIDFPTTLPASVGGNILGSFYYGTPTGIDGYNTYNHEGLLPDTDYYYRIRGEHYDSAVTSSLISYSDWVYCSGVDSLQQSVSDDVENGLISGSSSLQPGDNPDPKIKLSTAGEGEMIVYFRDGEQNVNLKSKFLEEIGKRGISSDNFLDYYTGVHFILKEGYTLGSSDVNIPALNTGGAVTVNSAGGGLAGQSELKINLYLREKSRIIGKGGGGGTGGITRVTWNANAVGDQNPITFDTRAVFESSTGTDGGTAIQIASSINELRIFLPSVFSIYGGGGGGGGGDRFFAAKAAANVRKILLNQDPDRNLENISVSLQLAGGSVYVASSGGTEGTFKIEDLQGIHTAGFGGGGQGYGISRAGSTKQFSSGQFNYTTINDADIINDGNVFRAGVGRPADLNAKISKGGDGGAFGQFGQKAPSTSFGDELFQTSEAGFDESVKINGREGGRGGIAIYCLNTSYTPLNVLGSLIFQSYDYSPDSISGFIARWDSANNVYSSGTTPAANTDTISSWVAVSKNSNITGDVKIVGGSTKPTFYSGSSGSNVTLRTQYFNYGSVIEFDGNATATIQGIVGASDDNLLNNDITEYDIFYVVYPNSFKGSQNEGRQFTLNRNGDYQRTNGQFSFLKFSNHSSNQNTLSSWTGGNSVIYENTGLGAGKVMNVTAKIGREYFENAFVYNVTASKQGNAFVVKSYINNVLVSEKTFARIQNLQFDIDPILGKYKHVASFCISDLIFYRRQLLTRERNSVYGYLTNRARSVFKSVQLSAGGITKDTPNNSVEDNNGFAGYVLFTPAP